MADFDTLTKGLYEKSFTNTIAFDKPFLRRVDGLIQRKIGGADINWFITKADLSDQAEWFGDNDRIQPQRASTKEKCTVDYKGVRLPLLMDSKDYKRTRGYQWTDADFVEEKVREGLNGMRVTINEGLWEKDGLGATVDGNQLIGIRTALGQDVEYAGLARSGSGTRSYFQSASLDGDYTDQATARRVSYDNWYAALQKISLYAAGEGVPTDNLLTLVGGDMYRSLKSQCSAQVTYKGESSMLKYGFRDGFSIDGVDVMWEKSWDIMGTTTDGVTLSNCIGIFNMATWKWRFAPEAGYTWGGWEFQGNHIGGVNQYMNVLMCVCALYCMNPRLNFWNTNWSA